MQIQISDEVNEALQVMADRNHRSKRMEVLAALDYYVQSALTQSAVTLTSTVPGVTLGDGSQTS
jgi:predicted transcriptional regulator